MGSGRSTSRRRHVVLLGQLRENRRAESAWFAPVGRLQTEWRRDGDGARYGNCMRAEPRRDRYEFFDALYGKLTVQ
jgi:hypothetical protein